MASLYEELGLDSETDSERLARELADADAELVSALRKVREHLGLSQTGLGKVLGVTQAAVSTFECEGTEAKLSTVRRYAHALGARVRHVVEYDGVDFAAPDYVVYATWNARTSGGQSLPPALQRTVQVGAANAKRTDFAPGSMSAEETPVHVIESIEELVERVSLEEVRTYAFSAQVTGPPAIEPGETEFEIEYSGVSLPEEIHDRFRLRVTTNDAVYRVDIGAVFSIDVASEVPAAIRTDFAERIGFMTAFPFIREAVSGLAARLQRQPPLLDLMRPGDLKINEDGESADPENDPGSGSAAAHA